MPKISEQARVERRQRIIDGAWRCAGTQGFTKLTVDDICAETGLSKGAFYGYFSSKDDLLATMVEEDAYQLDRTMLEIEMRNARAIDRLVAFARAMVKRGEDPATVQVTSDMWVMLREDPSVSERFAELVAGRRQRLRAWVDEAIAAGNIADVPANALAATLVALGDGLMLHKSLDPASFRWTNIAKVLDALLDGLRSEVKRESR
jgi:AcrR family transcriptional regulator